MLHVFSAELPRAPVLALGCLLLVWSGAARAAHDAAWNLTDIYPDQAAWERELAAVHQLIDRVSAGRARAYDRPDDLADLLDLVSSARGKAGKMAKVGLLLSVVDTSSEQYAAWREQGARLESEVDSAVLFIDPILLGLGEATLMDWMEASPHLQKHERRIRRTLFQGQYAWPADAVEFEAALTRLPRSCNDFYEALCEMDLDWPQLNEFTLSPHTHSPATRHADATIRRAAHEMYFEFLSRYSNPFALALSRRIEGDLLIARTRNLVDSVDVLLVLQDAFPPQTHTAITPAIVEAKPQIRKAVEALRIAYGLDYFSLDDIRARQLQVDVDFDLEQAHDIALRAAQLIGSDYAERMESRLAQPWMHLSDGPNKGGTVGVFWQVGGGSPHTIFPFRDTLGSSQTYSGAAMLMMGLSAIPADRAPDRREEDLPVFSNALWALGPNLHDKVLLGELKEGREALLANRLARYLRFVLLFQSMVDLEVRIGRAIRDGQAVTAERISELYWESLQTIFADTGAVVPDYWRYAWMDMSFAFYGPHYSSFVMAEITMLLLAHGVAEGDPGINHIVDQGISESVRHFSADVLSSVGIDLSQPESYRMAFDEIGDTAGRLLEMLRQ